MPTAKKLNLPEDCSKVPVRSCLSDKIKGACRISKTTKGETCEPNPDYLEDKDVFEDFFTDFRSMNIEEISQELEKKAATCKELDKNTCQGVKGLKYGCVYDKSWFFGSRKCRLNPDLYDRFFRKDQTCMYRDCTERAFENTSLCLEHYRDIKDIEKNLIDFQQRLAKGLLKKEDLKEIVAEDQDGNKFTRLEEYDSDVFVLNEKYDVFFLNNLDYRRYIFQLTRDIDRRLNKEKQCQAINIGEKCTGKGDDNIRCTNKGTTTKKGVFCGTHLKCYEKYYDSYRKIKDNYDKVCLKNLKLCVQWDKDMIKFKKMISKCLDGEAALINKELDKKRNIVKTYVTEAKKYLIK